MLGPGQCHVNQADALRCPFQADLAVDGRLLVAAVRRAALVDDGMPFVVVVVRARADIT